MNNLKKYGLKVLLRLFFRSWEYTMLCHNNNYDCNLQVLCCAPHAVRWLHSSNGQVPVGAIAAGNSHNGEPLYIGRVRHMNSLTPGKVSFFTYKLIIIHYQLMTSQLMASPSDPSRTFKPFHSCLTSCNDHSISSSNIVKMQNFENRTEK